MATDTRQPLPPLGHTFAQLNVRISRYDFARQYAVAFGFNVDLIKPVRLNGLVPRIYPDLSLATMLAETLGYVPTAHRVALSRMAIRTALARRAA